MVKRALANACRCAEYYGGDRQTFVNIVKAAATYHDLGKLDAQNQEVLRKVTRAPLPICHEDAGVEQLLQLGRMESAVLAAAHHAGLFSRVDEQQKGDRAFRDLRVCNHVDKSLGSYCDIHAKWITDSLLPLLAKQALSKCGFARRLALSCLVDADYGDTARHYGGESDMPPLGARWSERAVALDKYVSGLPGGATDRERERNELRRTVYGICRDADPAPRMRSCDAPVGTGKTTAVMAHLLRVAQARNLRHILVVLPYTNIITQSVEVYRKALVLDGEHPEDVVAEHHHRVEFAQLELRQFAALWKAPITVTTAVQFFETLGSCHPVRLRKLHELPGSAVFVDKAHAAIPSHLWPQMWRWLETWCRDWGGHLVLGSGSLSRFWDLDEYRELIYGTPAASKPDVPDLVSQTAGPALHECEQKRVCFRRRGESEAALSCTDLIAFVHDKPGPRLLIVNTVQTAAVIAETMRRTGHDILHLSTALAPLDRDVIIQRIKRKLDPGTP